MGKLEGKVALVTGAGRGIGRAIAGKLAAEGARLLVNDLDAAPAAETVEAVAAAGGSAAACPGNVTDAAFPERFVQTALERFGRIDIIVNNAGYTWDAVIQKMTDEQWDAIQDVHLKAPFRILRAAADYIRDAAKREDAAGEAVHRKVVNVSSIAGTGGNAGQANYAAAKAGVIGLTRAMAKEWGRYRVNVNCVAFGLIDTRLTQPLAAQDARIAVDGREIAVGIQPATLEAMAQLIPLGRAGTPEEAAGAVYLLCSPESSYVSGQTLLCAGGLDM